MIRYVALATVPLCVALFALSHAIVRYRGGAAGTGGVVLELVGAAVAAGLGWAPVLRALRVRRVARRARLDKELAWQRIDRRISAVDHPALGFAITARLARPA